MHFVFPAALTVLEINRTIRYLDLAAIATVADKSKEEHIKKKT